MITSTKIFFNSLNNKKCLLNKRIYKKGNGKMIFKKSHKQGFNSRYKFNNYAFAWKMHNTKNKALLYKIYGHMRTTI